MCGRYYVDDDTLKKIEKTVQEVDKRMFQYGIHNNRIVIPAGRFYEWNRL